MSPPPRGTSSVCLWLNSHWRTILPSFLNIDQLYSFAMLSTGWGPKIVDLIYVCDFTMVYVRLNLTRVNGFMTQSSHHWRTPKQPGTFLWRAHGQRASQKEELLKLLTAAIHPTLSNSWIEGHAIASGKTLTFQGLPNWNPAQIPKIIVWCFFLKMVLQSTQEHFGQEKTAQERDNSPQKP